MRGNLLRFTVPGPPTAGYPTYGLVLAISGALPRRGCRGRS
jgi:hypothetical protein